VANIRGLTVDFETDEPIAAVHVWLEDGSSEVYSDATGRFALPVFKAGTICILAEKPGRLRSEEDLDVIKGNDYELNIDLEADNGENPGGGDEGTGDDTPPESGGGSGQTP
jgi:hypothetical protein